MKLQKNLGVIVCEHISARQSEISIARRTTPIVPEDSGWHFMCDQQNDDNPEKAAIWTVAEIVDYDPVVAAELDAKVGTELIKDSKGMFRRIATK